MTHFCRLKISPNQISVEADAEVEGGSQDHFQRGAFNQLFPKLFPNPDLVYQAPFEPAQQRNISIVRKKNEEFLENLRNFQRKKKMS